jgi:SEC-C motif domain protein
VYAARAPRRIGEDAAMNPALPCPCGRGRPYRDCCGPLHDGTRDAATAEDLMRSRYSAYVLDQQGYLLASWHASTRPAALPPPEPGLRWLGLDVKRHVPIDDDYATVEFVARSKLGGRAYRLHERSRFVREGGRWFYVDGDPG